jgi:hypothetical protein
MLICRNRWVLGLAALLVLALCSLAGIASAATVPTVTVRIEGESGTLLPVTKVTLAAPEPVSGCAATSVATAINLALGGNWDHGQPEKFSGDFTKTILGETHEFAHESDTWTEWVNYKLGSGICFDLLSEGAEVLMVADHTPEPFYAPTVLPLVVAETPTSVQSGATFAVKVSEIRTPPHAEASPGAGEAVPAEGVTVSGGGASAVSGPDGVASLRLTAGGVSTLRATKAGDAPSATFSVCVHDGNDGNCGTVAPGTGVLGFTPPPAPGPYRGPFALVARVAGQIDGRVYRAGHGPRLLAGTISSHSQVTSVGIELRREYRGRCYAWDGVRERFVPARCGQGKPFQVATGGQFSYLLPAALPAGRYVLDVHATDVAGNTLALARGTSRTVFYVR